MDGSRIQGFRCTIAPQKMLSASDKRRRIIISGPIGGWVAFNHSSSLLTSDGGYNLTPGATALDLNEEDHGDIVHREWWVQALADGTFIAFIEVMGED